jgi:hypothetical protein
MQCLISKLESLQTNKGPTLIAGDLNLPDINWQLHSAVGKVGELFHKFAMSHGFIQFVNEPTRINNILDIVLINEPLCLSSLQVSEPFSNSDHNSVHFEICVPVETTTASITPSSTRYKWKQADFDMMSEYLNNYDWESIFMYNQDVDSQWNAFKSVLDTVIDLFVPKEAVHIPTANNRTKTHRYPSNIQRMMTRKRCAWRVFQSNKMDTNLRTNYNKIAAECRLAVRNYERQKEQNMIDRGNVGDFYKYANNKMSSKTGVGTLRHNGEYISDDKRKAEIFNELFSKAQTADNGNIPNFESRSHGCSLSEIHFTPGILKRVAKRVKPKHTMDPNGFSTFLIIKVLPSLSMPLCQLFQSLFSVGKIPADWKRAIITPIYKKGLASDPNNYRPVAITSVICKLMERIMVLETSNYLRDKGLINNQQHGFMKARSTSTNLLESLNDWTLHFNTKTRSDIAYIDFSKAFDKVSHPKLLHKLQSYGISGNLLAIISDFLSDRYQCCRVGSSLSGTTSVISGTIQGSCWGSCLFTIFISDLWDVLSDTVTMKLYADDVKLYNVIETIDDCHVLQHNINSIVEWSKTWQLDLSINKCFILPIGGNKMDIESYSYTIGKYNLPEQDIISDLGVVVDRNLTFSKQVNKIVSKAHARCGLMFRCFLSHDRQTLLKAYKTYVLPLLEYASSVWSPRLVQDIKAVESVQKRFTKRLLGTRDKLKYAERLTKLELESLETRRLRADLVLTYKLLFGHIDIDFTRLFTLRSTDTDTRGHNYRLIVPNFVSECRRGFFSERVVNAWNSLPADTDFSTLNYFKSYLNDTYLREFCKIELNDY